MKFEIFKFKGVTSTNDVAINLIQEEKKEIGCVLADNQTEGRGTHGKKWISKQAKIPFELIRNVDLDLWDRCSKEQQNHRDPLRRSS